jgi:WD40 repeat protein
MSAAWKTVRVFISSTFRDMQAQRDWLVRFVFPKLREELLKHRIHFIDVDLRWGVTSDQDALGVCREVIDECHPRFMCILGGRYGWLPEGNVQSITADEVHYGVLDRHAAKPGHSVFYFRKDEDTLAIPEADARSGGYREFAQSEEIERFGLEKAEAIAKERAEKLAVLKQAIIGAGLPMHHYEAKWSDAQRRLTELEAFGNQVHADLLQSLKDDPELAARFTSESTSPPDEFAEEAEQMEAFIEERTGHYITGSRQPLLDALLTFAVADGTPNIFVLTGEPGSGKSAFLAKFTRDLTTLQPPPFVIPHFIGASTGSTDLRRTLRRVCHELALAAGNTEPLPLDIKDLITHFQKLLAEAAGRQRVILFFDALNQFDPTDGAHWLNWLPRELPPAVRIVASVIAPADGQPEHQTLAILRNCPGTRTEKLEPLTEADTLAVIEGCLRRYAKRLSPEQLAALLAKPAGRLPLYVLTALEELRTLGTYEEITDRIRTMPGDARALFGWILIERLGRDPGFRDREGLPCGAALVEKFAACLGLSRHGLSPAELTALLDPGDPLGNVAALLRLLRPYLMRRGELLDFYHGQFREAAGAAHLDTPEKQRAAHQSVATCLQAFADPHRDGQCRDATPHALSELPHHQTRAEAWPDLIATLENIFFLEAKVTHGMAFELAIDFSEASRLFPEDNLQHHILCLLEEALRRDLHFIARHANDYPQALFQCLWNSGWWYDCPKAAAYYVKGCPPGIDSQLTLHHLLDGWKTKRSARYGAFPWVKTFRPPPLHLGAGQVSVFRGHQGVISSVAFSPNGGRVASGSLDKTVRVWNPHNGEELTILCGHEKGVTGLAFSPDGQRIASCSRDKTVKVWDANSGLEIATLHGHSDSVNGVTFSPDGRYIASGSSDQSVRLWDMHNDCELTAFQGHEGVVASVAFSPDGRWIVSGGDKTVRVWEVRSGQAVATLRGDEGTEGCVSCVQFSPDGQRIVSGSGNPPQISGVWNGIIRVWDLQGRQPLVALVVILAFDQGINSVAFSPDGLRIVGGVNDTTVRVWDAQSGNELAIFRGHASFINSVGVSPDGRSLVSAGGDEAVRIWDARKGQDFAVLLNSEKWVDKVTFSPDGAFIGSSSRDNVVCMWDAQTGHLRRLFQGHEEWITSLDISADSRQIVSSSDDHTVRVWDVHSGQEVVVLRGHEDEAKSAIFSPDQRWIASTSRDHSVRVWDVKNAFKSAVLCGHEDWVFGVAFSSDSKRIVTTSWDDTMRQWEAQGGRQLAVFTGSFRGAYNLAFSPDGKRIVGKWSKYEQDDEMRIWDAQSGMLAKVIRGNGDPAAIAAGSPRFPFRAVVRDGETAIERSATDEPCAWFSEAFGNPDWTAITTHPGGRIWAGPTGGYLQIISLEGIADGTGRADISDLQPQSTGTKKCLTRSISSLLSRWLEFLRVRPTS